MYIGNPDKLQNLAFYWL